MPRIILTGKNGYISNNLADYFRTKDDSLEILLLDLKDESWQDFQFCQTDTVIHCAALVHESEKNRSIDEYMKINSVLTRQLALKAKAAGVRQFIFMSTMAVYGIKCSCLKKTVIDENTPCNPVTKYGKSKFDAEKQLASLADDMCIAVVRPPIVYGKDCPGNYSFLKKIVLKFGVIPTLSNRKSMLYVDNLCECIYNIFRLRLCGLFRPQNEEYCSTDKLAMLIAECNNKKILRLPVGPLVKFISTVVPIVANAFGSEFYSRSVSEFGFDYNVVSFEESIRLSEK